MVARVINVGAFGYDWVDIAFLMLGCPRCQATRGFAELQWLHYIAQTGRDGGEPAILVEDRLEALIQRWPCRHPQ